MDSQKVIRKQIHKNIELMTQVLPNIKLTSNSCHSKFISDPIYTNNIAKKNIDQDSHDVKSCTEEINVISEATPPSSPPPNKSFIKRMVHRVLSSDTLFKEKVGVDHTQKNKFESEEHISIILSAQESSKLSSLNISQKTDTTSSRVVLLMKIAQSVRDLSLNDVSLSTNVDVRDRMEVSRPVNSDYIIPKYYINEQNTKGKLLDIDFDSTIIDSIRNLRALNPYQCEFLKTLSHEKLLEIIHEYDNIMRTYIPYMLQEDHDT